MSYGDQVYGPFGIDAAKGQTFQCERTVLAVVHTVTAATRLADVIPLVEADPRIQVIYTWAPASMISSGVGDFLRRLGGMTIPWRQATSTRFDLAVAAWDGLLEQLHAPVLSVSHGVGSGKYLGRWDGHGPAAARETAAPARARLIYRGRVISAALIVPTKRQLTQLRRSCPEALEAAVVGGDPCFDRLIASLPLRDFYRRALGVQMDQKLVAFSSTWGPGSALDRFPRFLERLLDELPPHEYRVAAILHPNAWYWHSLRQVRSWHAGSVRRGLILIPPEEGWRAVLAASDLVIGDHGSVTCYGASAGVPTLLASFPAEHIDPASPPASLGRAAAHLRPGEPIAPQAEETMRLWQAKSSATVRSHITDLPGRSAAAIRSVMYRLLRLPEPPAPPHTEPVAAPQPMQIPQSFGGTW